MSGIEIIGLTKRYHRHKVLSNVYTSIKSGDLVFLVGKNGSGKTTFIRCLLNLVKYDGKIMALGKTFAYCPEKISLPDYLSLHEFLYLLGRVKKIDHEKLMRRLNYYIRCFNLTAFQDKYLIHLSKGTRQKALIIQALLADVDIYIFDEPLNGLDIESRKVFMQAIRILLANAKTVIISTHQLSSYRFPDKKIIRFGQGESHDGIM